MINFKIITWNFGKQSIEKLDCIVNNLFKKEQNEKDHQENIYIVGLQEVHSNEIKVITQHLNNVIPNGYNMIKGTKSSIVNPGKMHSEFDLMTFIIYSNNINMKFYQNKSQIFKKKSVPENPSMLGKITNVVVGTKGYLWVDFKIDDIDITIVNVHLPFKDEDYSLKNFQLLNNMFKDKSNVIILGDYNTRSKVDDSCMNQSVCNVHYVKNAEGPINILEKELNNCKTNNEKCIIQTQDNAKEEIDECEVSRRKCDKDKDILIENDLLNQVKEDIMPDFKEDVIEFLPSYKINSDGEYSLNKNGKGRLSGYADRILVKGDQLEITKNTYTRLNCLGNDHFPILLEVTMKPSFLGGKKKMKKKTKKRKHAKRRTKKAKINGVLS